MWEVLPGAHPLPCVTITSHPPHARTHIAMPPLSPYRHVGVPKRQVTRMGNKGSGGPFAPLVVVVRNIVGEKDFNKLRGKAISYHSQSEHLLG